jgi:hypothetical protein
MAVAGRFGGVCGPPGSPRGVMDEDADAERDAGAVAFGGGAGDIG